LFIFFHATILAIRTILPHKLTPATAKHLGLPILFGKFKTVPFSDLLDIVHSKIEGWRSKTLSQAGKSTLIKVVVVSAISSYTMSIFLLPDGICKHLDKAFKFFL
jgi:hypothetical protein